MFGLLIESGSRESAFGGYLFGAALTAAAGLVPAFWSVAAERKPIETVARPLALAE